MSKAPHILICDDDPVVHESLSLYLDAERFSHSSAYDGEQALARVETDQPDLMILDLMMPKMSGTDVCREIRRTRRLPIIMLTAKGEEIDRVLGLELGATITSSSRSARGSDRQDQGGHAPARRTAAGKQFGPAV